MSKLILDCGPLVGKSNKSIDEARVFLEGYKTKRSREDFIKRSILNGKDSYFFNYDKNFVSLFKGKNARVYPVVPNASQYVRDMNNYGLIGMAIRRFLDINFSAFFLIPTGLKYGLGVLKKDFANIIAVMSDVEMVKMRKLQKEVVFLHPQMADLFLANKYYEPFEKFSELIRKYKVKPGVFTNNVGQMIDFLDENDSNIQDVCCPINTEGYMMHPKKSVAEDKIKKTKRNIYAYDITCGGTLDFEKSVKYVEGLGVKKYVIEKMD